MRIAWTYVKEMFEPPSGECKLPGGVVWIRKESAESEREAIPECAGPVKIVPLDVPDDWDWKKDSRPHPEWELARILKRPLRFKGRSTMKNRPVVAKKKVIKKKGTA